MSSSLEQQREKVATLIAGQDVSYIVEKSANEQSADLGAAFNYFTKYYWSVAHAEKPFPTDLPTRIIHVYFYAYNDTSNSIDTAQTEVESIERLLTNTASYSGAEEPITQVMFNAPTTLFEHPGAIKARWEIILYW